jgi:polyferredoxin
MIVYAALLTIVAGFLVYSLFTRTPLILDVIRDRNALYREVHGDRIENIYSLKVINLDNAPHTYSLLVSGIDQLQVATPTGAIQVPAGTVSNVITRLEAPAAAVGGVRQITITLSALDNPAIRVSEKARFIGPHT